MSSSAQPNNTEKDAFKSKFRGVYRCGRRWKAQLQSHGIQFYLGMFDTEEEAARAYDRKAREEKGQRGMPTNFNGEEIDQYNFQHEPNNLYMDPFYTPSMGLGETGEGPMEGDRKRARVEGLTETELRKVDYRSTTENMRVLWDRQSQVAQRLLLAKAAQVKLSELQAQAPDPEKDSILAALAEEVILLSVVKAQLEEAVSRCFAMGLDFNTSTGSIDPTTLSGLNNGLGGYGALGLSRDHRGARDLLPGARPSYGMAATAGGAASYAPSAGASNALGRPPTNAWTTSQSNPGRTYMGLAPAADPSKPLGAGYPGSTSHSSQGSETRWNPTLTELYFRMIREGDFRSVPPEFLDYIGIAGGRRSQAPPISSLPAIPSIASVPQLPLLAGSVGTAAGASAVASAGVGSPTGAGHSSSVVVGNTASDGHSINGTSAAAGAASPGLSLTGATASTVPHSTAPTAGVSATGSTLSQPRNPTGIGKEGFDPTRGPALLGLLGGRAQGGGNSLGGGTGIGNAGWMGMVGSAGISTGLGGYCAFAGGPGPAYFGNSLFQPGGIYNSAYAADDYRMRLAARASDNITNNANGSSTYDAQAHHPSLSTAASRPQSVKPTVGKSSTSTVPSGTHGSDRSNPVASRTITADPRDPKGKVSFPGSDHVLFSQRASSLTTAATATSNTSTAAPSTSAAPPVVTDKSGPATSTAAPTPAQAAVALSTVADARSDNTSAAAPGSKVADPHPHNAATAVTAEAGTAKESGAAEGTNRSKAGGAQEASTSTASTEEKGKSHKGDKDTGAKKAYSKAGAAAGTEPPRRTSSRLRN